MKKSFSPEALAAFRATKYLRICAGDHRFILIWVVVVDNRVIVRSWNDKPNGWYRAFVSQPHGAVKIGELEIAIRAVRLRSKRLNDAADDAFAAKYDTKANAKYVAGFRSPERKATTLELLPAELYEELYWEKAAVIRQMPAMCAFSGEAGHDPFRASRRCRRPRREDQISDPHVGKGEFVWRSDSLRKCIRPLVGDVLRAHDDDPRVLHHAHTVVILLHRNLAGSADTEGVSGSPMQSTPNRL